MKKLLSLFSLVLIIGCSSNKNIYNLNKNMNNSISEISFNLFSSKGYHCLYNNNECKIFFLPGIYKAYILINKNQTNYIINPISFEYNMEKNEFNTFKIQYVEQGIKISENLVLLNELNSLIDERFNGLYEFNDLKIVIDGMYKDNKLASLKLLNVKTLKPQSIITILDKNIVLIQDSIISEYPLYEYKFDKNNNLILTPLTGNYMHFPKIKYILKKQK